jgi:hypothetical protein
MKLNFGLTGTERKELVKALSEILETPAVYQKPPTYAFQIGGYHLDRYGVLTGDDNAELENDLKARGFEAIESYESNDAEAATETETTIAPETATEEAETEAVDTEPPAEIETSTDSFTIELPLGGLTPDKLENLCRMVEAKANLIKAAIGVDDLPIQATNDTVRFPWFNWILDSKEVEAYSIFINQLCKTAIKKARVTAKPRTIEGSPKYAMRCFLLSLGFIGEEYKAARKILLSRLEGNSSWKNGEPKRDENTAPAEPDGLAEALADAELIHNVNASFEADGADEQ